MGCTSSKVDRYEISPNIQRNDSNLSTQYSTHPSTGAKSRSDRDEAFALFGQVNHEAEHHSFCFDLSDISQIETFITKVSLKVGSKYTKQSRIQLNPAFAEHLFLEAFSCQEIEHMLKRKFDIPTVIYNPCVRQKGFCIQKKDFEFFSCLLEKQLENLFKHDDFSSLIIELIPQQSSWTEESLQNKVTLRFSHPKNTPHKTLHEDFSVRKLEHQPPMTASIDDGGIGKCIFKKITPQSHLAADEEKRILMLDDNLLNLKILLVTLLNKSHSILNSEEISILKKVLGSQYQEKLEQLWENTSEYIELSSRLKIYICRTPNQAEKIAYDIQPNFIISDQDLGLIDGQIALGTSFLKSLPALTRIENWTFHTMLYTASANEPHVLEALWALPQQPTLISKGQQDLGLRLKLFLSAIEDYSTNC